MSTPALLHILIQKAISHLELLEVVGWIKLKNMREMVTQTRLGFKKKRILF